MKNVIILHGTGETPNYMWLPWLKKELEKKNYSVSIPQLPDTDNPTLKNWLPVALKETYTKDTILVGHSAGGPLQLSVLQNIKIRIKQAILVAGYARPKGNNPNPEPILQESYDWKKIADHVDDIIFINSDNDPWGCNDIEGRYMLDMVGKGKLIILKGEGRGRTHGFCKIQTAIQRISIPSQAYWLSLLTKIHQFDRIFVTLPR